MRIMNNIFTRKIT